MIKDFIFQMLSFLFHLDIFHLQKFFTCENHILEQIPKIVSVNCTKFDRNTKFLYKEELQQNIIEYILGAEWKKNIPTMDNSMETS